MLANRESTQKAIAALFDRCATLRLTVVRDNGIHCMAPDGMDFAYVSDLSSLCDHLAAEGGGVALAHPLEPAEAVYLSVLPEPMPCGVALFAALTIERSVAARLSGSTECEALAESLGWSACAALRSDLGVLWDEITFEFLLRHGFDVGSQARCRAVSEGRPPAAFGYVTQLSRRYSQLVDDIVGAGFHERLGLERRPGPLTGAILSVPRVDVGSVGPLHDLNRKWKAILGAING